MYIYIGLCKEIYCLNLGIFFIIYKVTGSNDNFLQRVYWFLSTLSTFYMYIHMYDILTDPNIPNTLGEHIRTDVIKNGLPYVSLLYLTL